MKSKIAFVGLLVLIAGAAVAGLWLYLGRKPDTSVIEDIADKLKHNDISNEVNCHSVDDCGYQIKGEYSLVIKYGDMRIVVSRAAFFDEDFNDALRTIGVGIQYRIDEETEEIQYRVTYQGQPMEEYTILNF